ASVPEAYKALVRLLFVVRPGADGSAAPVRLTGGAGCEVDVSAELRPRLQSFLAGHSPRFLTEAARRAEQAAAGDGVAVRAIARDVQLLQAFYERGPRAVRRLQLRHGNQR